LASNGGLLEKRVFDLNILAIYLVKGHPGFESVSPIVEQGLRGIYIPTIMDFLPMRAYWIMTKRWGLPEDVCRRSIQHFLNVYDAPRYSSLSRETIVHGFQLAQDLKHDIFDCMYLALALQEKASAIITTDTDFEVLCDQLGLKYFNPVPREILKRFKEQNK
jgi:predicted nucleic acid-binding protein